MVAILLLVLLGFTSCEKDEISAVFAKPRSVTMCSTIAEANGTLLHYLELRNNQYVLTISKNDAVTIGVPSKFYELAIQELDTTNKLIKELQKDSNVDLVLSDPKSEKEVHSLWTGTVLYTDPKGTLTTNSQEEAISPFLWAPIQIKGIEFSCRSNGALTPVFECKTLSAAGWQIKTAIGTMGSNVLVQVPLYVSNDNIRVAFSTTDAMGGTASYQGYYY